MPAQHVSKAGSRLRRSGFALGVLVALLIAGVWVNGARNRTQIVSGSSTPRVVQAPPTTGGPNLPSGFSNPVDLVGDTAGGGVWFLGNSPSQIGLFHWMAASDTLKSWDITPPGNGAALSGSDGLVVGVDGLVWVGIGDKLFRADTISGSVTGIPMPNVSGSPGAEAGFPAQAKAALDAIHPILGMAIDKTGDLAIARMAAGAIQMYEPKSNTFSEVAVPSGSTPVAVASNGHGLFASALDNYNSHYRDQLLIWAFGTTPILISGQVTSVHGLADSFLAESASIGQGRKIDTTGWSPTATTLPASPVALPALTGDRPSYSDMLPVSGGYYAYETVDGVGVVTPSQGVNLVLLPQVSCGLGVASGNGARNEPSVSSSPQMCPTRPHQITADALGTIWYLSSNPIQPIGQIGVAAYA